MPCRDSVRRARAVGDQRGDRARTPARPAVLLRRLARTAENYKDKLAHQVRTAGWGASVAVNATTTIVNVEHRAGTFSSATTSTRLRCRRCPRGTSRRSDTTREPDFASYGRILYGSEERRSGGIGEFMLIDRGMNQSIALGARSRSIGTSAAAAPARGNRRSHGGFDWPTMSLVSINKARDAVYTGDFASRGRNRATGLSIRLFARTADRPGREAGDRGLRTSLKRRSSRGPMRRRQQHDQSTAWPREERLPRGCSAVREDQRQNLDHLRHHLDLASGEAGIATPPPYATGAAPVTANSRPMMTVTSRPTRIPFH